MGLIEMLKRNIGLPLLKLNLQNYVNAMHRNLNTILNFQ